LISGNDVESAERLPDLRLESVSRHTVYKAILKEAASGRATAGGDDRASCEAKAEKDVARDSALLSEETRKIVFGDKKEDDTTEKNKNNDKNAIIAQIKIWFPLILYVEQFLKDCYDVFDSKDVNALDVFIEKYRESSIDAISQYATGLSKDYEAVKNSLIYTHISNGPLEGINNRIKMIHRRSGGRAGILLLNAYMLLA